MAAEPAVPSRSVVAIRRARDLLHRRWRAALVLAALLVTAVLLVRGVYTVGTAESAAVLRFGRLVDDAVAPGLHLRLPAGADETIAVATGEVSRLTIGGDPLTWLTGDTNPIQAVAVVQYRIGRLDGYLFGSEDPKTLIRLSTETALAEAIAARPVDDVLTSAKAAVQAQARERTQARLDRLGLGVTIVGVNLQTVEPPPEATAAFRAVADSRAEAAEAVSRSQGEKERALRLARGESEQLLSRALSDADRRVQEARGSAERFEALVRRHQVAPEQTRTDLHRDSVLRALSRTRLIVLAPGEAPRISVELLESQTPFTALEHPAGVGSR